MLPQTALMRFLYLGNVQPVHICSKHDPTYEHVCTQLICIRDMLAGDQAAPPTYPFSIIERTLSADSAVLRRTESIIALAYCVRCVDSEPLRALVYSRLAELLTTDTDLFRFVHWATRLKANAPCASNVNGIAPEAAGSTGFGRGMRRAVAAWYHARSPLQLVDIVGRHRGQFRWTHCDLLAMCHVKFEPADQRLMVIQALHQRGVHILRQLRETFDSGSVERTPAVRRLEQYLLFKVCESTDVAARMFIDNGFRYEHVPSHLRASAEFWASVGLDRLPFLDLLRVFLTLNDQNALESAEPLCAAMLRRLASAEAATEADDGAEVASAARVQPLALLSLRNAYGKGVRPAEVVSANWYRKKHADEDGNMRPGSAPVLHCFARAINNAFNNVPDMGRTELFVTLDLRSASKRRRVFNMEHLNCYEAMVLLALALVKRGRTTVFAFTDSTEQQQLKMLKLSADDDFETAMLKCENFTVSCARSIFCIYFLDVYHLH